MTLRPLPAPPSHTWTVPGSKSITNRALILAALAEGPSRLEGVLHSDDTRHMVNGLSQLGIRVQVEGDSTLIVHGTGGQLRAPSKPIFVGNSGTTVRFLTALSCLVHGEVTLEGDDPMSRRPIVDLTDALQQMGVEIECPTGCPPLTVVGGRFPGGSVRMRGDRSSQYFSALLMVAPFADQATEIECEGQLVSRPYVEITQRMMQDFGVTSVSRDDTFSVPVGRYRARHYRVEPDASSASYPFALAAASGGRITVPGLSPGSLQGDYAFLELLSSMGAQITADEHGTEVRGGSLRGIDVDMNHISDMVMTLAAIAPCATGSTTIRNVAHIRIKETDRLLATVTELRKLGQVVEHGEDWLRITPRPVTPATIHCYDDHRMAMAFAVLGLLRPGITIDDPGCVTKTYPTFWQDVETLRSATPDPTL